MHVIWSKLALRNSSVFISYYFTFAPFYLPNTVIISTFTAQKMKFSIKDFLSKYDQIRKFLRIRSHLLKKSLMKNFIFCAVFYTLHVFILVWEDRREMLKIAL